MSKPKWVYWIIDSKDQSYEHKANLLSRYNLKVNWIHAAAVLVNHHSESRAFITIVNDQYESSKTENIIAQLEEAPELKSSRLILSIQGKNPSALNLAASLNFRDLIPFHLNDTDWLFRIVFSSASKPLDYFLPVGQISLNQQAFLNLPGRLVWLSHKSCRLETQVEVPLGSTIAVTGEICHQLGVKHLPLVIRNVARRELIYRFSLALEGEFAIPPDKEEAYQNLLLEIAKHTTKPKTRIFVAMRDFKPRQAILTFFKKDNYLLSSALQLKSLAYEPQFFSPDAIFIDEDLCIGEQEGRFQAMLASMTPTAIIFILKNNEESPQTLTHPQICYFNKSGLTELASLEALILGKTQGEEKKRGYLLSQSPFSFCSVRLEVKLTSIHPDALTLALAYKVKNFSICQISSQTLQKNLANPTWIKITEVQDTSRSLTTSHPYHLNAILCNLGQEGKRDLAKGLIALVEGIFSKFLEEAMPAPASLKSNITEISQSEADMIAELRRARKNEVKQRTLADVLAEPVLRFILTSIVIAATLSFFFVRIAPKIAEHYHKSGSIYVEQLKEFSRPKKENSD